MKNAIINYDNKYAITTELVTTLDNGVVIFKATVKADRTGLKSVKTTTAHASGYVDGQSSTNNIELEAINRAISLM